MADTRKDKFEPVDKLIDLSANIVGGVAGAAIGFFTAGPAGALIGAASGPALAHAVREVGGDFYNRHLSKREMGRIGGVMFFAAEKFRKNIENGQQIRQDEFFQAELGVRSAAEEIVEGVLLVAQRDHEEKKLQYYGNLLANIAFHPEIDRAQANLLIRLADRISYRQMCLLTVFTNKSQFELRQGNYRNQGLDDLGKIAMIQETYDLYSQEMLNCSGEALLGLLGVNPAMMSVQGTGVRLYNLMELWKIDAQELNPIAGMLQ